MLRYSEPGKLVLIPETNTDAAVFKIAGIPGYDDDVILYDGDVFSICIGNNIWQDVYADYSGAKPLIRGTGSNVIKVINGPIPARLRIT